MSLSSLRSVLFIETSKMGDVVSMLPLIQSFHEAYPHLNLLALVDDTFTDIVRYVPFVSEVIGVSKTQTVAGYLRSTGRLREVECDLAISASPSARNALFTLRSKSVFKAGYFDVPDTPTPFLRPANVIGTGGVMHSKMVFHFENIVERSQKIATALSIPVCKGYPSIVLPARIIAYTDEFLNGCAIGNAPFIVCHPFSGWQFRSWELENYVSLTDALSNAGLHTFIIGSREDHASFGKKTLHLSKRVHLLFGEPVGTLMGLLGRASLFIGNDSGPLHLATALGVRCIGLFGPASPDLTAPFSGKNIYFYEKVECSPCDQKICIRPEHPCINLISTEKVLEAAFAVLEKPTMVTG